MDLIVGEYDGTLYYWERAADGTLVAQTGASNPFDGIVSNVDTGDRFLRVTPAAVDWDGDGRPFF